MKVNYLTLIAGMAMLLVSATTRAEDSAAAALGKEANTASAGLATATTGEATAAAPVAPGGASRADTVAFCDNCDPVRDFILRAGAWAVHSSGSPNKVAEYQDLNSSPFWDVDGIFSNGDRTIDITATGNDNETTDGKLYFYGGKWLSADVSYDRFLHQLDSQNFAGWNYNGLNNTAGPTVAGGQNLNNIVLYTDDNQAPGKNYAIRVQEFKANFKGNITENLKWRVNVFGIDKEGDRQANAVAHCYQIAATPTNTNLTSQCHTVTQSQHIDWQTTEVTPSLEWRIGCDSAVEYSHTVRTFSQNDQQVLGNWNRTAPFGYAPVNLGNGSAGYDIVPDSSTQIDRLKFSTKIGCNNDLYVLGYTGYNKDELRDTSRNFNGADVRLTNTSIDTLSLTARGKYYREDSTTPGQALNVRYPTMASYYQEPDLSQISPQVDRETHTFGVDGRWRPFQDECGTLRSKLTFVGGYDYSQLRRDNATYALSAGGNAQFVTGGVFTQPDSDANTFMVGVEEKFSSSFTTFLRYKYIRTHYPLYGVTDEAGQSIDTALNSSLPTQENRIELGGTWTPTDHLMVNATFYVENAMSDAPYVNWQSNSLPFIVSAWYAPNDCWSFNAGAAVMDSWINQDVTLGQLNPSPAGLTSLNVPWKYTGSSDVFTLGSRYAFTEKASLVGDFEYVHGLNSSVAIVNPANQLPAPAAGAAYDLGQYTLVKMQSFRFGVGMDYLWKPRVTTYVRYNYYDYQDLSTGLQSGQTHMILGGMSALF